MTKKIRSLGWPSKTSSNCKQIPKNSNVYNFQKSFLLWEYRTSLKTEVGNFLQDTYEKSIYSFYFDSFKLWQKLLLDCTTQNLNIYVQVKKVNEIQYFQINHWETCFIYILYLQPACQHSLQYFHVFLEDFLANFMDAG